MLDDVIGKAFTDALTASPGIAAAVMIVRMFVGFLGKSEERNHETLRRFADAQKACGESQGALAQQVARQDEVIRRCVQKQGGMIP